MVKNYTHMQTFPSKWIWVDCFWTYWDQGSLKNGGEDCWDECNSQGGKCAWCGTDGWCCRKGEDWIGNGCDGTTVVLWHCKFIFHYIPKYFDFITT